MAVARSKLTAQGQISVPAEIRRRLGVGPGSTIEWDEEDGQVVVRRSGRWDSADIQRAIFTQPPTHRTLKELKAGVRRAVREKHAQR